jgi:hypothetical protein
MVIILGTQNIKKSSLEISRFNLSTEFVVELKMNFGELKMCFFQPLQFTIYATYETILTV